MVVLPGRHGEFAIMARHENFITELKSGTVYVHYLNSTISKFYISDGYSHVRSNICTLCVDDAIVMDNLDESIIAKKLNNVNSLYRSECIPTDIEVEFLNKRKTFYSVISSKCKVKR